MTALREIVITALAAQPTVETDEAKLISLHPFPTMRRYLCFEYLNRCHHIVQRVMRPFERMTIVTRICRGKVVVQLLAVLIHHTGGMDTLQQQGVVPCATVKTEVQTQPGKVVMKDRSIVSVSVIGEEITTVRERDEFVIDTPKRNTVLQQERFGDMMNRLRFRRNGELPFGKDVPVALVNNSPILRVHFYK